MKMADPLARLGNLAPLIEKHAPYLHLHPGETYLPGAFEDFIADRGVFYGPPRNRDRVPNPLPSGPTSRGGYLYYDWNDATRRTGNPDRIRIYIHALEHQVWGADHPPGIALQFWVWYQFKGPATTRASLRLRLQSPERVKSKWPFWRSRVEDRTVLDHSFTGIIGLAPFGEHQGDWQQVTLFFDQERTLRMIRCRRDDGFTDYQRGDWKERNGRPVLYVARNRHTVFASAGEHPTRSHSGGQAEQVAATDSTAFDIRIARVKAEVKLRLINDCKAGPAVDCAASGRVVAVSRRLQEGPLRGFQGAPAPNWLSFQGRAGDAEPRSKDVSQQCRASFTRSLADVFLDPIDQMVPRSVQRRADDVAGDILCEIARRVGPRLLEKIAKATRPGRTGPRMPAGTTDWRPDWQTR